MRVVDALSDSSRLLFTRRRESSFSSSCSWFWFKQIYTLMIACLRLRLLNERWKLSISNVPFWLILQSFIYFYSNEIFLKTTFFLLSVYNEEKSCWKSSDKGLENEYKNFSFLLFLLIFFAPSPFNQRKKQGSKQAGSSSIVKTKKKIGIRHFNFHRNKFLLLYVLHCSSFYGLCIVYGIKQIALCT